MRTKFVLLQNLKDFLLYGFAYLLWLVNIVVCMAVVIQFRSTANVLWVALGLSRWTLGLIDQLSILIGGLTAFIYVMFLESYYRTSVTLKASQSTAGNPAPIQAQTPRPSRIAQWLTRAGVDILLRRFVITIAIPLGVLAACLLTVEIALRLLP